MAARKTTVKDVIEGRPAAATSENESPGWMCANGEMAQHVQLVGTIVAAADDAQSYILDDGTARVLLRVFDARRTPQVKVGDLVRIVGRPREYGDTYIALEICKQISDPKWAELHRTETVAITAPAQQDGKEALLSIIRELDTGRGAPYDQILLRYGDKTDAALRKMLSDGEVFETAPGRIKVLE